MGAEHRPPGRPDIPLVTWARLVRGGLLARLTPTQRDCLAVIVAHTSQDGKAYPAASTIAKLTGHARSRIYKALQALETLGILQRDGYVKRRGENARGPVIYHLQAPPMCRPKRDTYARDTPERRGVSAEERGGVSARDTGGVSAIDTEGVSARDTQNGTSERNPERNKRTEAVRFASPSETASLTAPENGDNPNSEGPASKHGTGGGPDLIQWFGVDAPRIGLSLKGAVSAVKRSGATDAEIEAALAEVARLESAKGSQHTG